MEGGVRPLGFVTVKVSVRHWVAAPTSFMPPVDKSLNYILGTLTTSVTR